MYHILQWNWLQVNIKNETASEFGSFERSYFRESLFETFLKLKEKVSSGNTILQASTETPRKRGHHSTNTFEKLLHSQVLGEECEVTEPRFCRESF